jgi:hypothetical protein
MDESKAQLKPGLIQNYYGDDSGYWFDANGRYVAHPYVYPEGSSDWWVDQYQQGLISKEAYGKGASEASWKDAGYTNIRPADYMMDEQRHVTMVGDKNGVTSPLALYQTGEPNFTSNFLKLGGGLLAGGLGLSALGFGAGGAGAAAGAAATEAGAWSTGLLGSADLAAMEAAVGMAPGAAGGAVAAGGAMGEGALGSGLNMGTSSSGIGGGSMGSGISAVPSAAPAASAPFANAAAPMANSVGGLGTGLGGLEAMSNAGNAMGSGLSNASQFTPNMAPGSSSLAPAASAPSVSPTTTPSAGQGFAPGANSLAPGPGGAPGSQLPVGLGQILGIGVGAIQNNQANQANQDLENMMAQANAQQGPRFPAEKNWDLVDSYLRDPMSILRNNPGYQASQEFVEKEGRRKMASQGYNNSGNQTHYLADVLGKNANKWFTDSWAPIRDAAQLGNYPDPAKLANVELQARNTIAQRQNKNTSDIIKAGADQLPKIFDWAFG